jgi:hypothetical protein
VRSDEVTFTRADAGVSRAVDRVAPIASLLHLSTIHVALDGKTRSHHLKLTMRDSKAALNGL